MNKLKLIIMLFICNIGFLSAGWTDLNTGIIDNLTGVVFWSNYGIVSGHKGLYYTSTGGNGPASWSRYDIHGNPGDSLIYNHTKFTHAFSDKSGGTNQVFVCGTDTISGKAVIMLMNFPSLTYNFIYVGAAGSSLNRITYNNWASSYYAVGGNGLIVNFTSSSSSIVASNFNYDLTSIDFAASSFCIGANGVNINGTNNSNVFTYNVTPTPSNNYSGVFCTGTNAGYGVGNGYYKWAGGPPINQPNYDFGNLNARCMIYYDYTYYVGTDHGIFRSDQSYTSLEWQPTSLSYHTNSFWYANYNPNFYACGDNGTLLCTTDFGGVTKPYASISLTGVCKGDYMSISGITGTSTNCQWLINNTGYSNSCGGFSHLFNSVGQYTISLNVSNGPGLYDTATQVITIVAPPKINLPVSLNKNLLCHQEPITVTIDSSQLNVFYTLEKFGGSNGYGSSLTGNGASISFTSSPLSVAGNYYLTASSSLAACQRNFTDTIKISVEKTKANFHTSKLNVEPGESLKCFPHCIDAQNYYWTFSPGATPSNSGMYTPSTTFSANGATQIKLVCWSNHGCYDSIATSGPKVYNEPGTPDSCWVMVNNGTDPPWNGYYTKDISDLANSRDGFYGCGHFENEIFDSRYGDWPSAPVKRGNYMIKYSANGVAKWMVYVRQPTWIGNEITNAVEDKTGHVFIAGTGGTFYDNTGDSVIVSNYLARLDSSGKLDWYMTTPYTVDVTLDKTGNVFLIAYLSTNFNIKLNGQVNDTIVIPPSPGCNFVIIKIKPTGALDWYVPVNVNNPSFATGITAIDFDSANNLYMIGRYVNYVYLYSSGGTSYKTVPNIPGYSDEKMFMAKYDSTGSLVWKLSSYTQGVQYYKTVANALATDGAGNSYITGINNCEWNTYQHTFINADSTIYAKNVGTYFTAKINSNGICQWVQGKRIVNGAGQGPAGYKINVLGNEVSSLGLGGGAFTSQNNDTIYYSPGANDYFILVYDTLGNLLRLRSNGHNSYGLLNFGFEGFLRRTDGAYYCARNGQTPTGSGYTPFSEFSNFIPHTNVRDGIMTRFSGNTCGITYYPNNLTTSFTKQHNESSFRIYPNPTQDFFTIENISSAHSTIKLYDFSGRIVLTQKVSSAANNKCVIYTSSLQNGIFLVEVSDEKSGKRSFGRVVVNR